MSEATVIARLNILIPLAAGALLASIGLAKKYPTAIRYVSRSLSAWAYVVLSAAGAVLVTALMRAMGTTIIQHGMLNCILEGLLGAALFLGIISRLSLPGASGDQLEPGLKTIKDYIYDFLDDSIARRIMQIVESRIKKFGKTVDKDQLLAEASRLIGGPDKLSAEQKKDLRIRFDEYASKGDYVPIIRILIKYYELDYILEELSGCIQEPETIT